MIQPATPQLLALAAEMRPDWDPDATAQALVAAHNAGWTWCRTLHAVTLLLIADKASPRDLIVATRSPVQRTGDRGDYDRGVAKAREALDQAMTP